MDSSEYAAIKAQIEAELRKLAGAGKVTYYKDLGETIGKPPRWAMWKRLLDDISQKKPDITIIVLNATSGWPGQINYNPTAGRPTDAQRRFAQNELQNVFNAHCPGKPVPRLPVKRKK